MMKEINNLYMPDYPGSLPIPEYDPVGVLLKHPESDYLKDKDVLPTNGELPPNHLTATYWG